MRELMQQNRKAAIFITAALFSLLLTSALTACQVEDLIKVKVPPRVAEVIQTDDKISVSDSSAAWADWQAWVERESKKFADQIERSQEVAGVIRGLTETGLQIGQEAASTLPGGVFLTSGLALLGGLFLKRPGDKKKEEAIESDAFNRGLESGKFMASEIESMVKKGES